MSIEHCRLCKKIISEDACKLNLRFDFLPEREDDICRDCWRLIKNSSDKLDKYAIHTMFLDDHTVSLECGIKYGLGLY